MIETHVGPSLIGIDVTDWGSVDRILRTIAAPPDRGFLGSNTTLAVSVAATLAAADGIHEPLWRYLQPEGPPLLPMPMVQILAGGVHAGRVIDLQDVLVIPVSATSLTDAIELARRVREAAVVSAETLGHPVRVVGDEGGLAIPFSTNRMAVEFVARAIDAAGLEGDVWIAIDVAAGELVQPDGRYKLAIEGRTLHRDEWISELADWVRDLPLRSIEDPVDEDDWDGWQIARQALGVRQLVGDDLFATERGRLERGVAIGAADAILIKPNQRGTLSEAHEVLDIAQRCDWLTILSARSGESEDGWLADIAIGWRAGQIKVGSLTRSERTAKWNRLLEIDALVDGARLARPFF